MKVYWPWPTKLTELAVGVTAILLLVSILSLYPFEASFLNLQEKGVPWISKRKRRESRKVRSVNIQE